MDGQRVSALAATSRESCPRAGIASCPGYRCARSVPISPKTDGPIAKPADPGGFAATGVSPFLDTVVFPSRG
jgi:hypothetical protein